MLYSNKTFFTYAIALGVFGITNTEFGIVGILPKIAEHFQISVSQAGMLVSMFALIIAIFGPFMTLLLSSFNRKRVLVSVLLVFTIANIFSAFAPSYEALMIFRLLPAFLHPVYFSVAFAAAASSVPKDQSAIAVGKVFTGLTIGMVLGVPITAFIGDQFSLETAFLFSAVINAIALLGIVVFIPTLPVETKLSFGKQLTVLRKPQLWLTISTACLLLASLYSVYSYFAEYLQVVTGMSGKVVSIMLILFGASGIVGNIQAATYLSRNMLKTTIVYPFALGIIYLLVYYMGSYTIPMIIIILLWGAVFTSGLIVSQTWLTSEASEAPEFANSLFVSFANLGVTIGTTSGGWFISQIGIHSITWSGILFLLLALGCIVVKIKVFDSKKRFQPSGEVRL